MTSSTAKTFYFKLTISIDLQIFHFFFCNGRQQVINIVQRADQQVNLVHDVQDKI